MTARSLFRLAALLLALCCSMALTACAGSEPVKLITESQVRPARIPESLLRCAADPAIPAGDLTDRDIAAYLIELWAAGDDCRATLRAVVMWQAANG